MAAAALEQSVLESKDKDTLLEMAKALGVKANARLKKSDIIDKILDTTSPSAPAATTKQADDGRQRDRRPSERADESASARTAAPSRPSEDQPKDDGIVLGDDGEPLADWEIALREQGVGTSVSGHDLPFVFPDITGFRLAQRVGFDVLIGMDIPKQTNFLLRRDGTWRLEFG